MEAKKDRVSIDEVAKIKEDIANTEKAITQEIWEENPELDKRLNRKFDLHILPWLFGIW